MPEDKGRVKRPQLYVINDPTVLKIVPELANEIGLNESIMLLQIDYLISISTSERNGNWPERRNGYDWCFLSVRDLQEKYFSFWSIATINRTIQSLIQKNLIVEDNFNQAKFDKTRWLRLDMEGISKLNSIMVRNDTRRNQNDTRTNQYDTGRNQNDTRTAQNDTGRNQNETTIPETSTETSTETSNNNENSDQILNQEINSFDSEDVVEKIDQDILNNNESHHEANKALPSEIRMIFNSCGINNLPQDVVKILQRYSKSEVSKVAVTLQKRKKQGKVSNPTGLLVTRPEVIPAILKDEFYPDMLKTAAKTKTGVDNQGGFSEYKLYVPPEVLEELKNKGVG